MNEKLKKAKLVKRKAKKQSLYEQTTIFSTRMGTVDAYSNQLDVLTNGTFEDCNVQRSFKIYVSYIYTLLYNIIHIIHFN